VLHKALYVRDDRVEDHVDEPVVGDGAQLRVVRRELLLYLGQEAADRRVHLHLGLVTHLGREERVRAVPVVVLDLKYLVFTDYSFAYSFSSPAAR